MMVFGRPPRGASGSVGGVAGNGRPAEASALRDCVGHTQSTPGTTTWT